MTTTDRKLQHALFDWREEHASSKFRPAVLESFGAGLFLSDDIITRIVDCAHVSKLHTVSQLIKETRWQEDFATEFGESLLSVVHLHYPQPPPGPTTTVVPPSAPAVVETNTLEAAAPAAKKRAPVRCSACHQVGHNSKFVS